jgi:hypothetical protein
LLSEIAAWALGSRRVPGGRAAVERRGEDAGLAVAWTDALEVGSNPPERMPKSPDRRIHHIRRIRLPAVVSSLARIC